MAAKQAAIEPFQRNITNIDGSLAEGFVYSGHFSRIKHGMEQPVEDLHITFQSQAAAKPFTLYFEMRIGNIAGPITGKINVVIQGPATA